MPFLDQKYLPKKGKKEGSKEEKKEESEAGRKGGSERIRTEWDGKIRAKQD